jgi:hypothetical protein
MNPIDNHFKTHLRDHQMAPSEAVWDRIAGQVPVKRRRSAFGLWAGAASIALLFGFFGAQKLNTATSIYQPRPSVVPVTTISLPENDDALTTLLNTPQTKAPSIDQKPQILASAKVAVPTDLQPVLDLQKLEKDIQEATAHQELAQIEPKNKQSIRPVAVEIIPEPKDSVPSPLGRSRLLTYTANQVNNLMHGESLESPFQERSPLAEVDQVVVKINKFFKNLKQGNE